jgi:hypothetical protein
VLDMALILEKAFTKKETHLKGYLMMEIIPQNSGDKILKD